MHDTYKQVCMCEQSDSPMIMTILHIKCSFQRLSYAILKSCINFGCELRTSERIVQGNYKSTKFLDSEANTNSHSKVTGINTSSRKYLQSCILLSTPMPGCALENMHNSCLDN